MQALSIARYCFLVFSMLTSVCSVAQVNNLLPVGLDSSLYGLLPVIEMEKRLLPTKETRTHAGVKDPFIANNYKVSFTPLNSGRWKRFGDHQVWQLKIRSSGALTIALVLSTVKINAEERLYIYNEHGVAHSYTRNNIPPSGILPLSYLQGEEVVIEYQVPVHARPGTFTIETVSHGYIDMATGVTDKNTKRISNDCYVCLEGDSLQLAKRSVVKIIAHRESGSLFCTGTLVNNTAKDKRPFVLTAEHCIGNEADANRSIFIFDYDDLCNQSSAVETRQLQGADFLASSYAHDFTLVELNHRPSLGSKPYYAGWNLSPSSPGSVLSVHHPAGGPKRVSTSSSEVTTSDFPEDSNRAPKAFWKVKKWDTGITAGGSSGAPLFNSKYQVIGTLTGGSAQCDYPFSDYFQKLSSSAQVFANLKQWLDPIGSNVHSLGGLDPFDDIDSQCNTLTNITANEPVGLEAYATGSGFYSGYNSANISSYAEKFYVADSMMLTGASFSVGSVNIDAMGGLLIALHEADASGLPGLALYETFVPYITLPDYAGYVEFYPYMKVKGNFFVSYTLAYSLEDHFAMNQALWRSNKSNSAYVKLSSGWVSMDQVSPQQSGTSFAIQVEVCKDAPPAPTEEHYTIDIYPNPATSAIISKLSFAAAETLTFQVYDLQGRKHPVPFQVVDNNIVANISTLAPGMYVVHIGTPQKIYSAKVVKQD